MKKTFTIIILFLVCGGVFGDDVKSVSVMAGDSVALQTNLTELQEDDVIWWRFGESESKSLLAEIVKHKIWYARGRFRDKLQISDIWTGDLIIKNMKIKYSGLYEAEININTGTVYKRFHVTVKESPPVINAGPSELASFTVTEGESVVLPCNVQTQRDDLILWRFGDESALIAEVDMEDNKISVYDGADGRFKDKLMLNYQTGDLTITDSKPKHSGVYQLKISSNKQTLYKSFSVIVRESSLSSGVIAGFFVFFLLVIAAVIAAGLILYRSRVSEQRVQHEDCVREGNSATLKTGITGNHIDHKIIWKFGANGPIIAQNHRKTNDVTYVDDERFKNKLQLDSETGDLTINDITIKTSGDYHLEITRRARITQSKRFRVVVRVDPLKVPEGDSVKLQTGIPELQDDDQIQWRFNAKDPIIAAINRKSDDEISINCDDDAIFKNRLTLDHQTGSLTITNIKHSDSGVYELQIKNKNTTSYKKFNVLVCFNTLKCTVGDSVTLKTGICELKEDHQILWTCGDKNTRIAKINRASGQTSVYDGNDERFIDRLSLNKLNGDLTITNISRGHSDVYKLQINSKSESMCKSFILITKEKLESVMEGESLTLHTDLTDIQGDEVMILWMFGPKDSLIAKAKKMKMMLYDGADGRFKDKLELDQTGSLTIKNINSKHTGLYKLQIISKRETNYKKYRVSVCGNQERDGTGDLTGVASEEIPLLPIQTPQKQ
ncbi:uncharacterized protein [Misgurnus anguillicaudatus]|uniref:uncharacterized protein n=1 Tax=Misgurnus anguillicaudatus TaxID=75329 RepID=UPI003CCF45EA